MIFPNRKKVGKPRNILNLYCLPSIPFFLAYGANFRTSPTFNFKICSFIFSDDVLGQITGGVGVARSRSLTPEINEGRTISCALVEIV